MGCQRILKRLLIMVTETRQSGFALITVMLIVALVTIIASQLLYQQALNTQRSTNMLRMEQASSIVWGLENFIKEGLLLDAKQTQSDHLNEQWALPLVSKGFEGSDIRARLIDMQSMINLNNLQETDEDVRKTWQDIVKRYLNLMNLDPNLAEKITDWVDTDEELSPGGAESNFYLLKSPSYRAADKKMVLLDEIGLIDGVNFQIVRQQSQYLTALPTLTQINVNTAPVNVLMSLADWMTVDIAKRWEADRRVEPAANTGAFRNYMKSQTGFEDAEINGSLPDTVITIRSDYFYLSGQVAFDETEQNVSAVFYRKEDQQVYLVQRWIGLTHE